jgi:hypothetical protein
MDIISAYREVGTYRAAAALCGTTHKTVAKVIEAAEAPPGRPPVARVERTKNFDSVAAVVAKRVASSGARISAKRLLPVAVAAGYDGSARNFRRLVAAEKASWAAGHHRGRRPGVWVPGEVLAIDWGATGTLHVFCAVLAWSRWRFVAFADNERAETTFSMLAACFEALGGVPKVVLADRMGCLKGGVVANAVVPTPAYVRFATHYLLTEHRPVYSLVRSHVTIHRFRCRGVLDSRSHDRRSAAIQGSGRHCCSSGRATRIHRGPLGALPARGWERGVGGVGLGVVRGTPSSGTLGGDGPLVWDGLVEMVPFPVGRQRGLGSGGVHRGPGLLPLVAVRG